MRIKDYKCKCGHDDFFFADKGNQKGIYCSYCGKWYKWADKDEQNLTLEQEPILDKVKAEIEQLPRYGAKFPNRYLTVHVDIYEVLHIIDKYRGEVDCRECKAEYECYYCKKYEESEDKE